MNAFVWILSVMILISCALSEIQLIQPKSMAVAPGEMLNLNCNAKGFSVSGGTYLNWVRRPPGKKMVWLGFVDWTGITWRRMYAPFLQGRITISADTSTNSYSLQLRFLTAEDTATYYCAKSTARQNRTKTFLDRCQIDDQAHGCIYVAELTVSHYFKCCVLVP
uniref:Ig-like domain-containing protein n=1 Tax=Anolis carolinensis TaxID=28377 RepID=R4GB17_ANOCA